MFSVFFMISLKNMQCEDAHQHKKVFDQMTCLKCFVFCIKTVILLIGLGTDNTK